MFLLLPRVNPHLSWHGEHFVSSFRLSSASTLSFTFLLTSLSPDSFACKGELWVAHGCNQEASLGIKLGAENSWSSTGEEMKQGRQATSHLGWGAD